MVNELRSPINQFAKDKNVKLLNGLFSMATLSIILVAFWHSIWLAGKSLNYMGVAELDNHLHMVFFHCHEYEGFSGG